MRQRIGERTGNGQTQESSKGKGALLTALIATSRIRRPFEMRPAFELERLYIYRGNLSRDVDKYIVRVGRYVNKSASRQEKGCNVTNDSRTKTFFLAEPCLSMLFIICYFRISRAT